ncbi:MAG: PEGA domain-containing protein [Deltaproteobacteria bacterium]|nr:PEGA domain-containing protein [Deltaproteobacteria bacterium]
MDRCSKPSARGALLVAVMGLCAVDASAAPARRRPDRAAPVPAAPAAAAVEPAAPSLPPAPAPAPSVAAPRVLPRLLVTDFRAQGVSADLGVQATQLVAQAAHGAGRYSVITLEDVRQLMGAERARELMGCAGGPSCTAQLASGAGVEKVLNGSVGRVGTQLTASLSLLRAADGTVEARESITVRGPRELATELGRVVPRMLGGAEERAVQRWDTGGKAVSLAVLDLVPAGLGVDVAQSLTQVLSAELKRAPGASVISRDDIQALLQLQADKLQLGCDDASCLAEIGGALGVEKLVAGNIGRLAGSHIVTLRLISVAGTRVENRVTEAFSGPEDQLIRAVRHAGRRLLGLEGQLPGTLVVSSAQEGAALTLDGEARGTLPMKPLAGVPAGMHTLLLQRRGFQDYTSDIYVDPAETTALWVELIPVPLRWYQRWQVWASVGVAGAVVVSALVGLVVAGAVGAFAVYRLTQAPPPPGSGAATID